MAEMFGELTAQKHGKRREDGKTAAHGRYLFRIRYFAAIQYSAHDVSGKTILHVGALTVRRQRNFDRGEIHETVPNGLQCAATAGGD